MDRKYIFVTGGVVSGLGKGITAASLGRLLKARGIKVAAQKFDPYLNANPGSISPYQHGEVYITDDGTETDLDLGHYERFIDENLNQFSTISAGKIYWNVLNKERNGDYEGGTVQVIPHVTNEIKNAVYRVGPKTGAEVIITEIGGTVGDIESLPFLEAIRQVSIEVGHGNCLFIHVTLVPFISGSNELKSKPTQHSVKELQSLGITPNMIICRCDVDLEDSIKQKIAMFCNVKMDCVLDNQTVPILYEAPLMLEAQNFSATVCRELGIENTPLQIDEWRDMIDRIKNMSCQVKIALVGKYVQFKDSYISVVESLKHAGYANGCDIVIDWINSEEINDSNVAEYLKDADGIIVPGGSGKRGVDGKVAAVKYAREHDVPFIGIGLGMQVALIEFAQNVLNMADANSTEFDDETRHPVLALVPDQKSAVPAAQGTLPVDTMRRGAYPCCVKEGTLLCECYNSEVISERHRHKYEFNNTFKPEFEQGGMVFSGTSPDGQLVEAIELPDKRFFVGVQFHPEFLSRPNRAHPLIKAFIAKAGEQ